MTKFQKQMLTIAAAGALTAVTALPAMALENEFHGIYNFNAIFANYNGTIEPKPVQTNKADQSLEQRVRLQYIAKASNDLKLVTHFEINNKWGARDTLDNTYGDATDVAGSDLDTDGLNILTKHAYLDFNAAKDVNVTIGLQAYKDALAGIVIDADVPGVYVNTAIAGVQTKLGMARYADNKLLEDGTGSFVGDQNTDFYSLDTNYALNKDTKVGVSYYLLNNTVTTDHNTAHTVALTGATKVAGIDLAGFVAMQNGKAGANQAHYEGLAYNLRASMKAAGGTIKAGYLYASGDDAGVDNGAWKNTGVTTYNDSGMMLIVRNTAHNVTSTSSFIGDKNITNLRVLHVGYATSLSDKLSAQVNVGARWANEAATDTVKGFTAAEVNGEIAYKLYPNMTVLAQAGYASLDSEYAGKDPYTARAGIRFSF